MYPGHWSKVFPNKPAVVHASTGESVTYQQLDDRSNQLAQLMWYQGLRKGDHISIFMENNLAFFEVVWAALRSGLYLSTVNQYLTEDEAAYIVDNSESQVLVSSNQLSAVAAKLPAHCPAVKRWFMVDGAVEGYEDYSESISVHPAKNLDEEPAGTFMLYSSGTT
ncbi:AMP-binding protein, partial [Pseudomonadales bacterium]|nr:AMP-binding protein [Pseudomonadales bacterium]